MDDKLDGLKRFSILYVEDEEGIRVRLMNALGYYFSNVWGACDGEEGYALFKQHLPQIVLSDIHMHGGGGIALVKKLREEGHDVTIVMLSAYSREEYLLELINLKIDHFIVKPANAQRLLEGIIQALGDKIVGQITLGAELFFSPHERKVFYKETVITLSRREKEFLSLLHLNGRAITTYAMIEDLIWEGKFMSMEALKTFVKELRKKVTVEFLDNVPQEGYRLKI
jgi:DNA-binding response OmpR family regulator